MMRQIRTTAPRIEKYTTNVGRLKRSRRSSRERVGSGTMPNTAMRTAPPAIRMVPRIIHGEKTSPRMKRAKNAFHRRDTAPRGARITTGSDAIWTNDPKILEEMKMAKPSSQSLCERSDQQGERIIEQECSHGLRCSTRCSCSGKNWLRTWLLRCIVRPRD